MRFWSRVKYIYNAVVVMTMTTGVNGSNGIATIVLVYILRMSAYADEYNDRARRRRGGRRLSLHITPFQRH